MMLKRSGLLVITLLAASAALFPSIAVGADGQQRYVVMLRSGADQQNEVRAQQRDGNKVIERYKSAINGFTVVLDSQERRQLAADSDVLAIEPDRRVAINAGRDNSTSLWNLDRLDQRARPGNGRITTSTNGAGVAAYIVDTGIMASHEQLAGRVRSNGFTAIGDGRGWSDCDGHGTHVAGTVAGKDYGVAPGATLVAVRTLDCAGEGWLSDVVSGLDWIVSDHQSGQPAVANMSLGGDFSSTLNTAVRRVINDGVTMVAAAGNESDDACSYSPGSEPQALNVGSTTSSDQRSYFSNYGSCLDIFAPGSSILSAGISSNSAAIYQSGTSMAAPHVTGAVALLLQAQSNLTPSQVAEKIIASSTAGVVNDPGPNSANRLLYLDDYLTGPPEPEVPVDPELLPPIVSGPDQQGMIAFSGAPEGGKYLCAIGAGAELEECATPYAPLGLANGQHPYRVLISVDNRVSAEAQGTITVSGAPAPPNAVSGVTINSGAAFTNDPIVRLGISWPAGARDMVVVNRSQAFAKRQLALNRELFWALDFTDGRQAVEVQFRGPGGILLGTYSSSITLDRRPPQVRSGRIVRRQGNKYWLRIRASESLSGFGRVQVSSQRRPSSKFGVKRVKYRKSSAIVIRSSARPRWFRVADRAGNFSSWQRFAN